MARRLRVEWSKGRKVTADLAVPGDPRGPAVLLAHGAGAGRRHPFMAGLVARLVAAGHPTMVFDYPYMEEGRRAPDRMPALLACHRAAHDRLAAYGWPVVLAGKSMGGRMASHLAAGLAGPAGLAVYGYPLVSPSSGAVRDTAHLRETGVPMLFLSGSRDRLAPMGLLRPVVESLPSATLEVVEGAGHSFEVPARSGLTFDGVLDRLAAVTAAWLGGLRR
ncbi:MAG: dienelactone hydrolase family protein [Actinobacteria bacterium]|nr:dienelactone hydrolase family protein [Actinomycetota bacterium]